MEALTKIFRYEVMIQCTESIKKQKSHPEWRRRFYGWLKFICGFPVTDKIRVQEAQSKPAGRKETKENVFRSGGGKVLRGWKVIHREIGFAEEVEWKEISLWKTKDKPHGLASRDVYGRSCTDPREIQCVVGRRFRFTKEIVPSQSERKDIRPLNNEEQKWLPERTDRKSVV